MLYLVIRGLCLPCQLMDTAPSGVISNRAFCDTIMDMTVLTVRNSLSTLSECSVICYFRFRRLPLEFQ